MNFNVIAVRGPRPVAFFFFAWRGGALVSLLLACSLSWADSSTNLPARHDAGFSYIHDEMREVPWSIHILKVERTRSDFEFQTTLGHGTNFGLSLTSEQAKNLPASLGKPVAAINGDFYHRSGDVTGDPEGLQIVNGELVSGPFSTRVCLWLDQSGIPHRTNVTAQFKVTWPDGTSTPFGLNEDRSSDEAVLFTSAVGPSTHTSGGQELILEAKRDCAWLPLRIGQTYSAQVRAVRQAGDSPLDHEVLVLSLGPKLSAQVPKLAPGAILNISTATTPDLTSAKTALGGGPTLVRGGQAMPFHGLQMRHPRTAFGWNKDYFFMVEVDGRQRNLSIGMSLPELAAYMLKIGCEEALNLDGGGSSTLWVKGNVLNSPSEGGERPGANALVLVHKEKPSP